MRYRFAISLMLCFALSLAGIAYASKTDINDHWGQAISEKMVSSGQSAGDLGRAFQSEEGTSRVPIISVLDERDVVNTLHNEAKGNVTILNAGATGLITQNMASADELVMALIGGNVSVSNVNFTGLSSSAGTFKQGTGIVGFENGIILSSGAIQNVVGPNQYDNKSSNNGLPGDSDLNELIQGNTTYDATVLEFDFVPESDFVNFQYVFSSEEYNEYVNTGYNDVFGFFLNGQNIALVPGSNDYVSIDTINGQNNSSYYINNDLDDGVGLVNTEMDGLTTVMYITAQVNKGQGNHMKLAVADTGDHVYDTNVFIKSGSFSVSDLELEMTLNKDNFYPNETMQVLLKTNSKNNTIFPLIPDGSNPNITFEIDGNTVPVEGMKLVNGQYCLNLKAPGDSEEFNELNMFTKSDTVSYANSAHTVTAKLSTNEGKKSAQKQFSISGDNIEGQIKVYNSNNVDNGTSTWLFSTYYNAPVFRRAIDTPAFSLIFDPYKYNLWGSDYDKIYIVVYDPSGKIIDRRKLPVLLVNNGKMPSWYIETFWSNYQTGKLIPPEEIPVGEYTVKAYLANKDDTSKIYIKGTKQTFYVIFDYYEDEDNYVCNTLGYNYFGGKQHYFTPDYGELENYYLHIFDNRIFKIAINEVNGETSRDKAAKKLLKLVSTKLHGNWFNNSKKGEWDLGVAYKTGIYDTIELEQQNSQCGAQCLDFGNLYTAYLKTIGIPARPITGTNIDGWNFHVWTELNYPSGWMASDATPATKDPMLPHEYWGHKQIDTGDTTTVWGYDVNKCKTPNKPVDLRNVHYDIKSGISRKLFDQSIMNITIGSLGSLNFGENANITLNIKNNSLSDMATDLIFRVAFYPEKDNLISTNQTNYILDKSETVNIKAGESLTIPYSIPPSVYQYNGHCIATVEVEGEVVTGAEFDIESGLVFNSTVPENVKVNEPFDVIVSVTGSVYGPVNNLTLTPVFPTDVLVNGEENIVIPTLMPGEVQEVKWNVSIANPGQYSLMFNASNGSIFNRHTTGTVNVLKDPVIYINSNAPEVVEAGQTTGIDVSVYNAGDLPAENVSLTVTAPDSVNLDTTSFDLGAIDPKQTKNITVNFTHNEKNDFVVLFKCASQNTPESEEVAKIHVPSTDMYTDILKNGEEPGSEKHDGTVLLPVGQEFTFKVFVSNTGDRDLHNVQLISNCGIGGNIGNIIKGESKEIPVSYTPDTAGYGQLAITVKSEEMADSWTRTYLAYNVSLEVETHKESFDLNEPVLLNVKATNSTTGIHFIETKAVVEINGQVYNNTYELPFVSMAPGENRQESMTWQTQGLNGGAYTINCSLKLGEETIAKSSKDINIGDEIAPATVNDLSVVGQTLDSITLTWTAPGNDGNIGIASQYDIRYSTSPIDELNWGIATQCNEEPVPQSAGSMETFIVNDLQPATTYYFAIKSADGSSNWSAISNVVNNYTWENVFGDNKNGTKLWINTDYKTFQFMTSGKTFPIKKATMMNVIALNNNQLKYNQKTKTWSIKSSALNLNPSVRSQISSLSFTQMPKELITFSYINKDLFVVGIAISGNMDYCKTTVTDITTGKSYLLVDNPGVES